MIFTSDKVIRFQHCDPAGIVFFPQYLVLCHETLEDWIETGLGIGFGHLIMERRIGTPAVSAQCEFLAPSRLGERVTFELGVKRLGNSSVTLQFRAQRNGELRMRAELVVVIADLVQLRGVPIPEDLRAAMTRYLVPADTA